MANVLVANNGQITSANRVIVRTSGDRVYIFRTNGTALFADKGNQDGEPTSFSEAGSQGGQDGLDNGTLAAAIDSSDIVHLTWTVRDTAHGGLLECRYRTFDTNDDTFGTVEKVADLDGDGSPSPAQSICVDANDEPHVMWRDALTDMGSTVFSNYNSL